MTSLKRLEYADKLHRGTCSPLQAARRDTGGGKLAAAAAAAAAASREIREARAAAAAVTCIGPSAMFGTRARSHATGAGGQLRQQVGDG